MIISDQRYDIYWNHKVELEDWKQAQCWFPVAANVTLPVNVIRIVLAAR